MRHMKQGQILVVEDDIDTAEMLNTFFEGQNYAVDIAMRGNEVLSHTNRLLPDLIILDIMLPGMDGYEVCRELRTTTRTSHIPIIFLTQKDERSDRIAGLELGADDYITKPFDLEELGLRAKNAIQTHQRQNMTDPRTGLPSARLIEEQLRTLTNAEGWTYAEFAIHNMQPFFDAYGFVAADEVLRYVALILNEVVIEDGTSQDFIGQAGGSIFVLITHAQEPQTLINKVRERFDREIKTHYGFVDAERGGIEQPDGTVAPLMTLSVGKASEKDQKFADIREITEVAAAQRRRDFGRTA